MDNASSCDTLAAALGAALMARYRSLKYHDENNRVRCLAHAVNLIVQSFLSALNEAANPDVEDYFIPNKYMPFHYDIDDDEEFQEVEQEPYNAEMADEAAKDAAFDDENFVVDSDMTALQKVITFLYIAEISNPSFKLRLTCTKIVSSPQRRAAFKKLNGDLYGGIITSEGRMKADLMVIRDVRTRWNYTEAMMTRALLLRKVYLYVTAFAYIY